MPKYWAYFNYGVLVTTMISACVVFFGTIIGTLVALARRTNIKILNWIASLRVWIFRGVPMVAQIMIAFAWMHFSNAPIVSLGILDLDFSRLLSSIITISLNNGAYISEIVRVGIEVVPKGQLEAAYSLGIRPVNVMRHVILPQAPENTLLALGNEFITTIKDSPLPQTIDVVELRSGAQSVVTVTYLLITPLLFVVFYYLMVTAVMSFLVKRLEKRMGNEGSN